MKRTGRFTKRELLACEEALISRLAGERDNQDDPEAPTTEDYEAALSRVWERLPDD
jgi:hypothetical protein